MSNRTTQHATFTIERDFRVGGREHGMRGLLDNLAKEIAHG